MRILLYKQMQQFQLVHIRENMKNASNKESVTESSRETKKHAHKRCLCSDCERIVLYLSAKVHHWLDEQRLVVIKIYKLIFHNIEQRFCTWTIYCFYTRGYFTPKNGRLKPRRSKETLFLISS